jgi:hypothetical protein
MRKFPALGSALVLALTGAFIAAPALAHTRHPSTPQEREQTRQLNMQALQQAQGQAPANQQAMNGQQQQQAAPTPQQGVQENQAPANSDQSGNSQAAPTTAPSGNAPADNTDKPAAQTPSAPQQQQPAPSGY